MPTLFPMRAKRGDPENGYMVVQQMVEFLRDAFDKFTGVTGTLVRGSATVLATNFTVVVPLGVALATYSVALTPTINPGGAFWVSAKSATQFQINLAVVAPVGGISFDWVVKSA